MLTKLLGIDGTWLVHRAFHVIKPSSVKYMVHGWVCKFALENEASHIVVAFDSGKTFRHQMYPEYKGTRLKKEPGVVSPSDLMPDVVKYIQSFGIHCQLGAAFEADDVLATLGHQGQKQFREVLLVTRDKDNLQCITSKCRVLRPGTSGMPDRIIGTKELLGETGFSPGQYLDYQTLIGDKTDNVPQVLTPAKAKKLILTHKSLKNYLIADSDFTDKHYHSLVLNRRLVRLVPDCFTLEVSRYSVDLLDKAQADCRSSAYRELCTKLATAKKRLF